MNSNNLSKYLDELLRINEVEDDSLNGLQVENSGEIKKVALAVDGSAAAAEIAVKKGANFLFVHHGLFWGKSIALTGLMYGRVRILIENNIALYAAHLPLDMHAELGNNAQIEKVLGWPVAGNFGEYHGSIIGKEIRFEKPVALSDLARQFQEKMGFEPRVWAFGKEKIERLGYVSGGAVDMLKQAVRDGMDAYVTGEPAHSAYWTAKESGINVIFGGHYATETLGVKAVGKRIQQDLGIEAIFIDLPTGY